jgi:iron complex transport system permease protein
LNNIKESFFYPKNYLIKVISLLVLLLVVFIWSVSKGSTNIGINHILDYFLSKNINEETNIIIGQIRFPRVILASLAGMALASSGMVMQGIFRNPLVDPFIIGVSGGASLGAGIALLFNFNQSFFGLDTLPVFAFIGALSSIFFSYKFSLIKNILFIDRLLLSGIAISSLTSALLSLLLVLKGQDANSVIFWIMGSFSGKSWEHIKIVLPYFIISNIVFISFLHKLNILSLGDEASENLGIDTQKLKIILIIFSSILAASIVSVSGVIGFIGMIIPQITRLFIKSNDYRFLYLPVILLGAIILTFSDTISRIIIIPQEIPVGIFTALLGVPFFIYLLRNNQKIY